MLSRATAASALRRALSGAAEAGAAVAPAPRRPLAAAAAAAAAGAHAQEGADAGSQPRLFAWAGTAAAAGGAAALALGSFASASHANASTARAETGNRNERGKVRRSFPKKWGKKCQPITFKVPPRDEQGEQGVYPKMKEFLDGDMCKEVAGVVEDYCIKRVVEQWDLSTGRPLHPKVPAFDDFADAFIEATDGKWTLPSVYNGLNEDMWERPQLFKLCRKTVR